MKGKELLDFLNVSTPKDIDQLGEDIGSSIGEKTSKKIIEFRDQLPNRKFTSLKELDKVEGVGEAKITKLLNAIAKLGKVEPFIKSNTLLTFWGEPAALKEFKNEYKLVDITYNSPSSEEEHKENSEEKVYELYYKSPFQKDKLIQAFQTTKSFLKSNDKDLFAVQGKDNKFLTITSNGTVTFGSTIDDNGIFTILSRSTRIGRPNNANEGLFPYQYAIFGKLNGNILYYDYANQKIAYDVSGVISNQVSTGIGIPNNPHLFETTGSVGGGPSWAAFGHFRAFTLMNYYKTDLSAGDPRVYMGQEGGSVVGTNRIGWLPKNWYRHVQVIKDVNIISKHYSTGIRNHYLMTSPDGSMSFFGLPKYYTPVPAELQFDMYFFYGCWNKRKKISAKVVFRSKLTGKLLSVNPQNNKLYATTDNILTNEIFSVEQGWGNGVNDVNLKTQQGKYLYCYNQFAKVDSVIPNNFEQFTIQIP